MSGVSFSSNIPATLDTVICIALFSIFSSSFSYSYSGAGNQNGGIAPFKCNTLPVVPASTLFSASGKFSVKRYVTFERFTFLKNLMAEMRFPLSTNLNASNRSVPFGSRSVYGSSFVKRTRLSYPLTWGPTHVSETNLNSLRSFWMMCGSQPLLAPHERSTILIAFVFLIPR